MDAHLYLKYKWVKLISSGTYRVRYSFLILQRKHFNLWYQLTWIHPIDSGNVFFVGYSLEHFFVGFHYSHLWRNKTFDVVCEDIYLFHESQLTIKRLKTQIHISWHIFYVTILLPISLWINIQFRIQFNTWVLFIF